MKVLVIAPHPDDETLGCGGTLLKYAANGHTLHWLLITAMTEDSYSEKEIRQQIVQVNKVKAAYPFNTFDWLQLPTTRLETLSLEKIIEKIRMVIKKLCPEIVLLSNRSDVHSDHRVIFQAASSVLKPIYMREYGVEKILMYETLSETESAPPLSESAFMPNVYVDISNFLNRKLEIMELYETEMQSEPLPRTSSTIRALARYRGATVAVQYAESFMLLREIG